MKENFAAFLTLVWPDDGDFDSPKQGYHVTPGDPGGGTYGGVTEATWEGCVTRRVVSGTLRGATTDQLRIVLQAECWGSIGDALPAGLDVLVGNGRMMSGEYPWLLQQCLGFIGSDVDGDIGPDTIGAAVGRDATTLIHALHGRHYAYLSSLSNWPADNVGWTRRLVAAHAASLALA